MKEGSYEYLTNVLHGVNLFIGNRVWSYGDTEGVMFKATISSLTVGDQVTLHEGASYTKVTATASSTAELIEVFWNIIKSKKLLVGTYGNYTCIIEWNKEKGMLEKRLLLQEEAIVINCIL